MPPGTLEALVETDRRFFEAGATNDRIGAATLSWMAGHTSVPAGCVVHSVDAPSITSPGDWLDAVEAAVRACGAPLVRVYLDGSAAPVRRELERRGYSARTERAYATTRPLPAPPRADVGLRPLSTDDETGWASLAALHRASGIGSGIYEADPDDWTELWRRKCASGDLDGHLITCDRAPCGSVGMLHAGGVLRMKNTLVDRRSRRRAIARSVLSLLSSMGRATGCQTLGAFVIDGTDGRALLDASGFEDVGAQIEWSRML